MAVAKARVTHQFDTDALQKLLEPKIAAATKIFAGTIAAVDANGRAIAVSAVATRAIQVLGRNERDYDNSAGAADAFKVQVRQGAFGWKNSAGIDAIAEKHRGQGAYVVDNETVALSSRGGTRAFAGIIQGLSDDSEPILEMGAHLAAYRPGFFYEIPVNLASLANAAVAARFTPGIPGKLQKMEFQVTVPATTAAKLATLTANVAGVAATNGTLALTSANCTPMGNIVSPAAAFTAGIEFGATDEITVTASAVTAFVEGAGVLRVYCDY